MYVLSRFKNIVLNYNFSLIIIFFILKIIFYSTLTENVETAYKAGLTFSTLFILQD